MSDASIITACLKQVMADHPLTLEDAVAVFHHIMSGDADPVDIAALLTAWSAKGVGVTELLAGATVMRAHITGFPAQKGPILDTCGTGGTGLNTVNISTASALVAAAQGASVAKHGNRAVSSASGSSDILSALGARVDLPPEQSANILDSTGFCFLLAPIYHPAIRHVMPVRTQLGIRTIFNLLGPLTNPAGAKRQVVGVYNRRWLNPFADVLLELGTEHAWIVHGGAGEDEISLGSPTDIIEVKDGQKHAFTVQPQDIDINPRTIETLRGGTPDDNAASLRALFAGADTAYRDAVILNAGAGLYVSGFADSWQMGAALAREALADGKAATTLDAWVTATQEASHG